MWRDEDEWGDRQRRSLTRRDALLIVPILVALLAGAWLVASWLKARDDGTATLPRAGTSSGAAAPPTIALDVVGSSSGTNVDAPPTTAVDLAATSSPVALARTAAAGTAPATGSTPPADAAATTTAAPQPATTVTAQAAPPAAGPVTLPDGSIQPVVATFGADRITLTGEVPSEDARQRLVGLAVANSKVPVPVDDQLTIDPAVPLGVPVRVIELTSVRFPAGSAEVRPEHAAELDRVANVMKLLPNVTVLVVGHADQRGDDATNFRLSELRAQAVVSYLVGAGVAPSRLASRAVGESDLLSFADDATALALNRRTEFVFSGLLIG